MDYLKEEEIKEGAISKVYINGKFEAYAKLIKEAGEKISFINETCNVVYVRQRWLVEWACLDDIPEDTPTDMKWTQRELCGKKAHRKIEYKTNLIWDDYWENRKPPMEDWGFSNFKPIDDYGDAY